jgi:hypothetical protein
MHNKRLGYEREHVISLDLFSESMDPLPMKLLTEGEQLMILDALQQDVKQAILKIQFKLHGMVYQEQVMCA